jgi:hypothetical protein
MASTRRGSGGSNNRHTDGEEPLSSLWPQLDDAEYLEVTESVPVAAFGLPITKFTARYVKNTIQFLLHPTFCSLNVSYETTLWGL